MSTAMVMTMATPTTLSSSASCCPGCGYSLPSVDQTQVELLQAQARNSDLETQVRLLNQKATAAVDRWADYEDELARLRSQVPAPEPEQQFSRSTRQSFLQTGTTRLSALLSSRKTVPGIHPELARPLPPRTASAPAPITPTEQNLREALSREQSLRKEAEGRLSATSKEVEELSAALFEQANEMVAEERRARAKLEERVGELEKRDFEKRRRLERLEVAMRRIDRVRELLAEEDEKDEEDEVKSITETDESESDDGVLDGYRQH